MRAPPPSSPAAQSLRTRFLKEMAAACRVPMSTLSSTATRSRFTSCPGECWNCTPTRAAAEALTRKKGLRVMHACFHAILRASLPPPYAAALPAAPATAGSVCLRGQPLVADKGLRLMTAHVYALRQVRSSTALTSRCTSCPGKCMPRNVVTQGGHFSLVWRSSACRTPLFTPFSTLSTAQNREVAVIMFTCAPPRPTQGRWTACQNRALERHAKNFCQCWCGATAARARLAPVSRALCSLRQPAASPRWARRSSLSQRRAQGTASARSVQVRQDGHSRAGSRRSLGFHSYLGPGTEECTSTYAL